MDDTKRHIAVGFTAIAGLIGLAVLLMLFGYLPAILEGGYDVHVRLPDAGGLHTGSRATLRGIDVGQVKSIDLQPPPEKSVVVTVRVRDAIRLPEGTSANLQSGLLGGNTTIAFQTDHTGWSQGLQLLPMDGTASIEGESSTAVGMVAKELRTALSEPMAQFADVAERFERLAVTWDQLGKNLRDITEPIDPAAVDAGDASPTLSTLIVRADARLNELHGVLQGIDSYVSDPQLRDDLTAAAANARTMTQSVTTGVDDLTTRYLALADDMSKTLAMLNEILNKASNPDGTLGKMLVDPSLYNNFNDAAERLNKMFEEAQLLLEKWKAEGVEVKM